MGIRLNRLFNIFVVLICIIITSISLYTFPFMIIAYLIALTTYFLLYEPNYTYDNYTRAYGIERDVKNEFKEDIKVYAIDEYIIAASNKSLYINLDFYKKIFNISPDMLRSVLLHELKHTKSKDLKILAILNFYKKYLLISSIFLLFVTIQFLPLVISTLFLIIFLFKSSRLNEKWADSHGINNSKVTRDAVVEYFNLGEKLGSTGVSSFTLFKKHPSHKARIKHMSSLIAKRKV
jgi:Zn-dependent protease with chaperone function